MVPPKPSLMSSSKPPGLAAYSGKMGQAHTAAGAAAAGDPNRLAVLAQTSAQSSVESGPDTTTEGSVYRNVVAQCCRGISHCGAGIDGGNVNKVRT